jgi:hypothetical protein
MKSYRRTLLVLSLATAAFTGCSSSSSGVTGDDSNFTHQKPGPARPDDPKAGKLVLEGRGP